MTSSLKTAVSPEGPRHTPHQTLLCSRPTLFVVGPHAAGGHLRAEEMR